MQGQLGYAPEAVITAVLVIVGLTINSNSHLEDHSKLALEVLLGVFEIVFLFSRRIERRLKTLSDDSLTVIPRDRLGRVLYQHLDNQRTRLLTRAEQLADQSDCELEKHEMYAELIGLTNAVTLVKSGHADGTIVAISSTNVEDFEEEPSPRRTFMPIASPLSVIFMSGGYFSLMRSKRKRMRWSAYSSSTSRLCDLSRGGAHASLARAGS